MLKVFNKDPHFMRDAVIVDNYAAAWDIICSMQERLGARHTSCWQRDMGGP